MIDFVVAGLRERNDNLANQLNNIVRDDISKVQSDMIDANDNINLLKVGM